MKLLIILSMVILISMVKAQEPIVITGKYTRQVKELSKQAASGLFIHEWACIAFPISTERSIYTLKLDEESEQRVGWETIGVIFVNNVGVVRPPLYGENPLTLEVFPFEDNIYYCKNYAHQDVSSQNIMKMYDDMERDITLFLQHPELCDTLKYPSELADSRYTPLLIKNLSNEKTVYIQQTLHGDGVRVRRTKFLGIVVKKEKERIGYSNTYYESIRMSDFARSRLKTNFRPIKWDFVFPDTGASAEVWQAWFDGLFKEKSQ